MHRAWGSLCCATLMLSASASCVSLPGSLGRRDAVDAKTLTAAKAPGQGSPPTSGTELPPPAESAGVVRISKPVSPSRIQQTAYETEARTVGLEDPCLPETRWPAAGCDPLGPGCTAYDMACCVAPKDFPDEYLCDGGDRDFPVHYDATSRLGLDTEDTIAEYTEHTGRNRIKAANRVCVYAPRFASVRVVSLPHEDQTSTDVVGLSGATGGTGLHSRQMLTQSTKRDGTNNIRVRSRASGLESEDGQLGLETLAAPGFHEMLLNTFQDLAYVRTGTFEQADGARLQLGLQSALIWSRELNPVITAQVDVPTEGLQTVASSCLTVVDDLPSDQPGKLKVVKLADKKEAEPGDVITFTIRYDNAGPREVHHVRIVDNLTPRLEYIADSAKADREGNFLTQDNGEGSLVLIWELDETLPAGSGGVVTFQCRVR